MTTAVTTAATEAVLGQRLVDHHCHGVVTSDLDRAGLAIRSARAGQWG